MTTLDDKCYEMAAAEVAARQLAPAPLARAVSDSLSDKDKVIPLYIKHRVDQLRREITEQQQEERARRVGREAAKRGEGERLRQERRIFTCPKCGYHGLPKHLPDPLITVILAFFLILPAIAYVMTTNYDVCPKCGRKILPEDGKQSPTNKCSLQAARGGQPETAL